MKSADEKNLAKEKILEQVRLYYQNFVDEKKTFEPGDKIPYAGRVFDENEMVNLVDSALEFWLTSGRYTVEFEKRLGEYLGIRYCSAVNSGSSANLLAFMALTSPFRRQANQKGRRGDYGGGGLSDYGVAGRTIRRGSGFCGRYHTAV